MNLCQICQIEEATEQLPNESGMFVCYGCKVIQRDVVILPVPEYTWDKFMEEFGIDKKKLCFDFYKNTVRV